MDDLVEPSLPSRSSLAAVGRLGRASSNESVLSQSQCSQHSQISSRSTEERTPRSGEELRKYAGFISHYKDEAAMEARFLKETLEDELAQPCFLDSDDLKDLRLLAHAVCSSEVLVLVQTAGVLTRPWCLVELATAIDHGVPIVGVSVASGPRGYSFEAAPKYLAFLDEALERANPGAAQLLEKEGFSMVDLAYKLSCTLPEVISIQFNPGASRNVLTAVVKDIAATISSAVALPLPPMERWEAKRTALRLAMSGRAKTRWRSAGKMVAVANMPRGRPSYHQVADRVAPPAAPTVMHGARASIPPEVPTLPASMQMRPSLLASLKRCVLHGGVTTKDSAMTSISAPTLVAQPSRRRSHASATGMGGVGKSVLAAAVARDDEVGRAFERITWVSLGQEPDLLHVAAVLHVQLTGKVWDREAVTDMGAASLALRSAAAGVRVLCVLDDVWDASHMQPLQFLDPDTGSAILVTSRIRQLLPDANEVQCNVLTTEEALTLLLQAGDIEELSDRPPEAALQAVELCGRLPLALSIAGSIIRELPDVWEDELCPLLSGSEELGVESRLVSATFSILKSPEQRAGVEACFAVYGVFPEDATVPVALFDALTPLVIALASHMSDKPRTAVLDVPKGRPSRAETLRVRRWLSHLLRGNLLRGSLSAGTAVHDLIRDVMSLKAQDAPGGMRSLQRHVIRLLQEAYFSVPSEDDKPTHSPAKASAWAKLRPQAGDKNAPLQQFLQQHLAHHVRHAKEPERPVQTDALLVDIMAVFREEQLILRQVGLGTSVPALREAADACMTSQEWMLAATIYWTMFQFRQDKAVMTEAMRGCLRALRSMPAGEQTSASRTLELNALTSSYFVADYAHFGSVESIQIMDRISVLLNDVGTQITHASRSSMRNMLITTGLSAMIDCYKYEGVYGRPEYRAGLKLHISEGYRIYREGLLRIMRAADMEEDKGRRTVLQAQPTIGCLLFSRKCLLPEYVDERISLREYNENWNESMHIWTKSEIMIDFFVWGISTLDVLLRDCNLQCFRQTFEKLVLAYERLAKRVAQRTGAWADFDIYAPYKSFNMLAALLATPLALRDPTVRQLLHRFLAANPYARCHLEDDENTRATNEHWAENPFSEWKLEGKYIYTQLDSFKLNARACAASLALREAAFAPAEARHAGSAPDLGWLPTPEALEYLIDTENYYDAQFVYHPALNCGALYGEGLGQWTVAERLATYMLASKKPEEMPNPNNRILALLLLARSRAATGRRAHAWSALEAAASEAAQVGFRWYELVATHELLQLLGNGHGLPAPIEGEAALFSTAASEDGPKNTVTTVERSAAAVNAQLGSVLQRMETTPEELQRLKGAWETAGGVQLDIRRLMEGDGLALSV